MGQAGTYLVVVAIVLAVLIPLFWMVSASLKTQNEVYDFAWLPRVPQWHNYVGGLTTFQFGRYFINTIIVTGINVVAGGIVASWTAFAMARLEFPGRNLIFALVLGTMMLPFRGVHDPQLRAVPLARLDRHLHRAHRAILPCRARLLRVPDPPVLHDHPARVRRLGQDRPAATSSRSTGTCCCRCRVPRSPPSASTSSWPTGRI